MPGNDVFDALIDYQPLPYNYGCAALPNQHLNRTPSTKKEGVLEVHALETYPLPTMEHIKCKGRTRRFLVDEVKEN